MLSLGERKRSFHHPGRIWRLPPSQLFTFLNETNSTPSLPPRFSIPLANLTLSLHRVRHPPQPRTRVNLINSISSTQLSTTRRASTFPFRHSGRLQHSLPAHAPPRTRFFLSTSLPPLVQAQILLSTELSVSRNPKHHLLSHPLESFSHQPTSRSTRVSHHLTDQNLHRFARLHALFLYHNQKKSKPFSPSSHPNKSLPNRPDLRSFVQPSPSHQTPIPLFHPTRPSLAHSTLPIHRQNQNCCSLLRVSPISHPINLPI